MWRMHVKNKHLHSKPCQSQPSLTWSSHACLKGSLPPFYWTGRSFWSRSHTGMVRLEKGGVKKEWEIWRWWWEERGRFRRLSYPSQGTEQQGWEVPSAQGATGQPQMVRAASHWIWGGRAHQTLGWCPRWRAAAGPRNQPGPGPWAAVHWRSHSDQGSEKEGVNKWWIDEKGIRSLETFRHWRFLTNHLLIECLVLIEQTSTK